MKSLKDIDRDHSFYSDKGDKAHKALLKQLEAEEKAMVEENRRRYRDRNKGVKDETRSEKETEVKPYSDLEEQVPKVVEPDSKEKRRRGVRGVRGKELSERSSYRGEGVHTPTV